MSWLRQVLELLLKVAGWLPAVRRARARRAFRRAVAEHDERAMNRLWQERMDRR